MTEKGRFVEEFEQVVRLKPALKKFRPGERRQPSCWDARTEKLPEP